MIKIQNSSRRHVLVVEDNELNREMLSVILEQDYEILCAENGKVGLDMLREHFRDISAVILDIIMPVMNGYEFLHEVKNDQLLSEIPIIVATGSTNDDEEAKCLQLGAADFVLKPYNPRIVLSRTANIIKLREQESTLSKIEYDDVSGIYTSQAFTHHADRMLRENPDVNYTLIVSDIEDFQLLTLRYGVVIADSLIRENARVMRQYVPQQSICGRYSGNQLAALVPRSEYKMNDQKTRQTHTTLDIPGHGTCNVKFGIKRNLDHSVSIREHCRHAQAALSKIYHQYGQYFAVFDDEMLNDMMRREFIEQNMEKGLLNGEFRVFYQPKHNALTGALVGAEALVRWINPEQGMMSPAEFIPVFEDTGFISEIDYFSWQRTCCNVRRWIDSGVKTVPISVNCSRTEMLINGFTHKWMKPLDDMNIPPHHLHLEVTESLFCDKTDRLANVLAECKRHGIEIELDDFGTGYSSLSNFIDLPIDIVKFDMHFVRQLSHPRTARLMRACVKLVHDLGLSAVAEGVEEAYQLEMLKEMGVDTIQGYYFSAPLSEEDFLAYMENSQPQ